MYDRLEDDVALCTFLGCWVSFHVYSKANAQVVVRLKVKLEV